MRNVFVFRESQWLPVPKYKWMMYDCMRTWRSSLITISSATPHLPGYTWPSTLLCYISLFSGCWNIYIIITKRSVQRSVERLPSWTTGNTCPIAYRQKHNYTKHIETCFWFGLYLYSKRQGDFSPVSYSTSNWWNFYDYYIWGPPSLNLHLHFLPCIKN